MITPNYKELALEGKFLLLDVKQAAAAEHNRRSAHVVAARSAPTAPAATARKLQRLRPPRRSYHRRGQGDWRSLCRARH